MLKTRLGIFASIIILFTSHYTSDARSVTQYSSYIVRSKPGQSVITLINKAGINPANIRNVFQSVSGALEKRSSPVILNTAQRDLFSRLNDYYVLDLEDVNNAPAILDVLKRDQDIISITPNYIFHADQLTPPNDPDFQQQWALKAVNALEAWMKATGKGVKVGIVDTGIDYNHPDLQGQFWINSPEDINHNGKFDPWPSTDTVNGISGDLDNIDEDGNGYIDDVIGYSFVSQKVANIGNSAVRNADPFDENGHGTAVAGVVAAKSNNSLGISGLAYDAKLVALRVLDATGNGESDDIASAIVYAALNDIRVLNFSFGEYQDSPLIHDAVKFANSMGCFMTASSGNDGSDEMHYPSDYEELISVGASTDKNQRHYLSNYGSRIGLLAPGSSVLTLKAGGGYKPESGTSLASPHVSAVAAMLLETNPSLTPTEIRGILEASALDAGSPGWDIYYGSGLLDASSAVNTVGKSRIQIDYPIHEQSISIDNSSNIPVKGTVITPMLKNFQVFIGEGLNQRFKNGTEKEDPTTWTSVSPLIYREILNDTLAFIPLSSLSDTVYTVRILINLKNGNTLEHRIFFYAVSNASKLRIDTLSVAYPYFNDKRIVFIASKTNRKAAFSVKFRPKGSSGVYSTFTETESQSPYHTILIDTTAEPGQPMEATAIAVRDNGDTAKFNFEFTRPGEAMPTDKFSLKPYTLPPAYLCKDIIDFYGDQKKTIALNDLSSGTWGYIKLFEFSNNKFSLRDSSTDIMIPAGIGNVINNGLTDILTFEAGNSYLFESPGVGNNPFTNLVWQNSLFHDFWAATLFDINKDGKQEIIAYSDTSFIVVGKVGTDLLPIALASNPEIKYKQIGTFPGWALGDFDGDGNNELCFGDFHGNIFIYSFSNNQFTRKVADTTGNTDGNNYITSGDIDGDGKPEIIIANFGQNVLLPRNEGGTPLWRIRILKYNGGSSYSYLYNDYIYGVRAGFGYNNGLASGDLDKKKGDEIILAFFPNLYIFKWDPAKTRLEPFWWYPAVFSNNPVIFDFDGNGVNETGFTGIVNNAYQTAFFEYNAGYSGPDSPPGFSGHALDESSAIFSWNKVSNAEYYILYELIVTGQGTFADSVGMINSNTINLNNLSNNTAYNFVVRSFNQSLNPKYSDWSDIVGIFTHTPVVPVAANQSGKQALEVNFSGRISEALFEPSVFSLLDSSNSFLTYPATAIISNDTMITITFPNEITEGSYGLAVKSFADYYHTPTREKTLPVAIHYAPGKEEIYLTSLQTISFTRLLLEFSQPVVTDEAINISNYTIQPRGQIVDIQPGPNSSQVFIILGSSEPIGPLGITYTLTASNIHSLSGAPMTTGAGNTLSFVFSANDPNSPFVYPNPVRFSENVPIFFANLPLNSDVIIMSLESKVLRVLHERDGNGGITWDGRDSNDEILQSGIYLFKVKQVKSDGSTVESDLKKFAFVR